MPEAHSASTAAPRLSLVIPTYNERENIERLLPAVTEVLRGHTIEILVVDDQSPDGTAEAVRHAERRGLPVRLVSKVQKEGIGAALRVGYNESRGALLASMDADLSFDPADLPRLLAPFQHGADLVIGTRHARGSLYEAPTGSVWVKKTVSTLGNGVLRTLTGIPLTDFSGNFRIFRREVWEAINTTERTNALLFETILKAYVRGFRVAEVPVTFRDRRYGQSKLQLGQEIPKFLRKFLRYLWEYRRELWVRRWQRTKVF